MSGDPKKKTFQDNIKRAFDVETNDVQERSPALFSMDSMPLKGKNFLLPNQCRFDVLAK